MEIALAISQGGKFANWEANIGKVYYIDTELEGFDFQKRMRMIAKGMGHQPEVGDMRKLLLRGYPEEISSLVDKLSALLKNKSVEVIIIDAIYSLLGDREENSNEDITSVGLELFRLAKNTGAGVIFIHHFSKGAQTGKRGIEKASGAGAWGRFPDVSLAIDRHVEKDCFNFEVTSRTFGEIEAFVGRRVNATWEIDEELEVEHKGSENDLNDMLNILAQSPGGLSPKDWLEKFQEQINASMSYRAFGIRRGKLLKRGFLDQTGETKSTVARISDRAFFDSESGEWRLKPKK